MMDFSSEEMGITNCFEVQKDWTVDDITKTIRELYMGEGSIITSRVDICLPLGCDFSIYLVSGHDEKGHGHMCLVCYEPLAQALAQKLRDGEVRAIANPMAAKHANPHP